MSTTAQRGSSPHTAPADTKVSVYDRVSAMLAALVVLFAFLTFALFAIWLTRVITIKPKSTPTIPIELRGEGALVEGVGRDFEEPGVEELADVQQPQIADAIEAVTSAASTVPARVEAVDGNAAQMGAGQGLGDSRATGPGGGGTADEVAEYDRWEINYATSNVRAYAAQLEFFNIELGAVHRSNPEIYYASKLTQDKPERRTGFRDQEDRVYFGHVNKQLRQFDTTLLERASIDTTDMLIVQFYPTATRQMLLDAERRALGGKSLATVRKTVFSVQQVEGKYQFEVTRQEFR